MQLSANQLKQIKIKLKKLSTIQRRPWAFYLSNNKSNEFKTTRIKKINVTND